VLPGAVLFSFLLLRQCAYAKVERDDCQKNRHGFKDLDLQGFGVKIYAVIRFDEEENGKKHRLFRQGRIGFIKNTDSGDRVLFDSTKIDMLAALGWRYVRCDLRDF